MKETRNENCSFSVLLSLSITESNLFEPLLIIHV